MNRVTAGGGVPGWTTAWTTYVAVVRTTASPVNAGRKRNATATGIRKNASRACEYAPPDRTASTPIATMSIAGAAVRPPGQDRGRADRDDVDRGLDDREPVADAAKVDVCEYTGAPGGEERQHDE